jgi:hypothetical protein
MMKPLMATAERRFLPRRLVSAKQCEDGSFQAKAGPIRRVSAGIATPAGPDPASPIHPSLGSSFGGQGPVVAEPCAGKPALPGAAFNATPATNASGEPDAPAKDRLR